MPRRFSPADAILILILCIFSAILFLRFTSSKGSEVIVEVQNRSFGKWGIGEGTDTIDVAGKMRVVLSPKGVDVISALCHRQICVQSGRIIRPGQSILCVPNRILLRVVGQGEEEADAVVQ